MHGWGAVPQDFRCQEIRRFGARRRPGSRRISPRSFRLNGGHFSKHGRRRAVINPHPRMVGRSGRLGAATRVVPQRFVFRLCLLVRQRRFTGEKSLIFLPKGLQSAARIILPQAAKFHTGSLRGIFSHAHVARENDLIFSRLRTRTLRGIDFVFNFVFKIRIIYGGTSWSTKAH